MNRKPIAGLATAIPAPGRRGVFRVHLSPGEQSSLNSARIECEPPEGTLKLLSVRRITMPARAADLLPLPEPLSFPPGVHRLDLGNAEARRGDLLIFEFDAGEHGYSGPLEVDVSATPSGQQVLL